MAKLKVYASSMVLLLALVLCQEYLCMESSLDYNASSTPPRVVKVGAIVALDTTIGKVAKTAIQIAVDDINSSPLSNSIVLQLDLRNSWQDPVRGAFQAMDMMKNGCVAIVGPQTSVVSAAVAHLADKANIPMVTFAGTNPSLSIHRYPFFMRISPSDRRRMQAIADILSNFGWTQVMVVYVDDDYGAGAIPSLYDSLRDTHSKIIFSVAVSPSASLHTIRDILGKLRSQKSTVIVVHLHIDYGVVFFREAQKMGMVNSDYVWIITNGLTDMVLSLGDDVFDSMNRIIGIKTPIPRSSKAKQQNFMSKWKPRFNTENPKEKFGGLNVFALSAYDAVWVLAHSINNLIKENNSMPLNFEPKENPNDPFDVGVSTIGEMLKKEILKVDFFGLTGQISLSSNGEPRNCNFDIVNIADRKIRVVGAWDSIFGLNISNEDNNFQSILWPGGTKAVPQGWKVPNGKKLRFAVPWNPGFPQFVSVVKHNTTNKYQISGFCVDVFDAVVKKLGFELPYELRPYGTGNITPEYYDNLAYEVYLQKYDGVVGDLSILANRSKFVDFTQPYTEMGLVGIVRMQKSKNNPWAFLQPFTPGMWITTLGFFFFTGAVLWLLEHKHNTHFRGKPRKQVTMLLWFSFSTAFFAHRERVVSNLGRLTLMIWLCVVLVLTSSYTASLSSMLTINQMVPQVQSVDSLKNTRLPIGYRKGAFVEKYLSEQLGFDKKILVGYNSMQEYIEALHNGPHKGGVAAIFEVEVFSDNLLLAVGCDRFAKIGPTFKTGGAGFIFPKGSPLVSEISKGVLHLSESDEMQKLRDKWFNMSKCQGKHESGDEGRLSIENFGGVFLLSVCVSLFAVVMRVCWLLGRNEFLLSYDSTANDCSHCAGQTDVASVNNDSSHGQRDGSVPTPNPT